MKNTIAFIKESFKNEFIATLITLIVMAGLAVASIAFVAWSVLNMNIMLPVVTFVLVISFILAFQN